MPRERAGFSRLPARRAARLIPAMAEGRKRRRRALIALAGGLLAVAAYARWIEPAWLETTRHRVELPIPAPLLVAHVTDLHSREIGRIERSLLDALAAARPDAIVITGDSIQGGFELEQCRPVLAALAALAPPRGVFKVLGNWETAAPRRDWHAALRECGVTLLKNESVELAPGLWIAGFDDAAWGLPELERTLAPVPPGAAVVGLVHEPRFFAEAAGRVDLLLAGHTHGGQVRLPFLPLLHGRKADAPYVAGLYERDGSLLYVSRGIGMSVARFRLLSRPELALLELAPVRPSDPPDPPR